MRFTTKLSDTEILDRVDEIVEQLAKEGASTYPTPPRLFDIRHWFSSHPSAPRDVRQALRSGHLDRHIAAIIHEQVRRNPNALRPTPHAPAPEPPEPGVSL